MRMRKLVAFRITLFAFLIIGIAGQLLAQAAAVPKPAVDITIASVITALGVVAIPWIVWGITLLIPVIPRAVLPFLPLVLAWIVEQLPVWMAGVAAPIGVAGIALAALVLREVLNTIAQHGFASGGGKVGLAGATKVLFSR
jgi:hypothetical protein